MKQNPFCANSVPTCLDAVYLQLISECTHLIHLKSKSAWETQKRLCGFDQSESCTVWLHLDWDVHQSNLWKSKMSWDSVRNKWGTRQVIQTSQSSNAGHFANTNRNITKHQSVLSSCEACWIRQSHHRLTTSRALRQSTAPWCFLLAFLRETKVYQWRNVTQHDQILHC